MLQRKREARVSSLVLVLEREKERVQKLTVMMNKLHHWSKKSWFWRKKARLRNHARV